jgi:hypothetical protein
LLDAFDLTIDGVFSIAIHEDVFTFPPIDQKIMEYKNTFGWAGNAVDIE